MMLNEQVSQYRFGEMVGISQPAVSDLVSRGVLQEGGTAGEWLLAYCGRLREVAAGRGSMGGELDLVQERAALARAQRVGQDIKNEVAAGTYAPVDLLARVLGAASAAVVERLEGLPGRLQKALPDLPQEAHEVIATVVAAARNEWARATVAAALRADPMMLDAAGDELEQNVVEASE